MLAVSARSPARSGEASKEIAMHLVHVFTFYSTALKDRPPPIIQHGPTNQTVAVGTLAVLGCRASGEPEPTVTWLKDGLSLFAKEPRMSLLEAGSLQIQNVKVCFAFAI